MLAPKTISSGRGAEKIGERGARALDRRIRFGTGRIVPVRVGVVVIEVVGHRLDDRARHLSATGTVEVGHRAVLVHALKRGKVTTDGFDRRHLSAVAAMEDFGHGPAL